MDNDYAMMPDPDWADHHCHECAWLVYYDEAGEAWECACPLPGGSSYAEPDAVACEDFLLTADGF